MASTTTTTISKDVMKRPRNDINYLIPTKEELWKLFAKDKVPFLAMPPEIHLKIFSELNPIDATCFSLVNKYIYSLTPTPLRYSLLIGSPSSDYPIPNPEGCKFCVPVLFSLHHCELHHHLRSFMPKHLQFCGGRCEKYTLFEQNGYSDSHLICGVCGTSYRRRYERGSRMLDMLRPGEKQQRLNKWYNDPQS